jgi:hypothetical protein
MVEKLTPMMQARLEKWRKNTLEVKSAEKVRGPLQLKRRNVRGDYGDDISDFEQRLNDKVRERK